MRNILLALVAVVAVVAFGASPAHAGATCKVVPTWCPPTTPGGGGSPVPEPGTLAVLAAGALGAKLAAARRNKK